MWLLWLAQPTERSLARAHTSVPPSSNPAAQLPTTATSETTFTRGISESHGLEGCQPFPKLDWEPCPVKIIQPSTWLIITAKTLCCQVCVAPLSKSWYSQQQGFQPLGFLCYGISPTSQPLWFWPQIQIRTSEFFLCWGFFEMGMFPWKVSVSIISAFFMGKKKLIRKHSSQI